MSIDTRWAVLPIAHTRSDATPHLNFTCSDPSDSPCDPHVVDPVTLSSPPTDDSSSSSSFPCQGLDFSLSTTLLVGTVISAVSIVTIAGNALVIASFATDRKLRSFGNYFILNLAISDLIVGLLIAVYMPYLLRGCWELTRVGCLIFTFLDYVVPLASAWNMALISLDRYWSVARAIEYRQNLNTERTVAFMTVPWIAGTLWYGPTVLFWSQFTGQQSVPSGRCQPEFYDRVTYLIASSVVEFLLPFVTVATINILIYLNIRRRSRGLLRSGYDLENHSTLKAKNILSRDKKSARSLAILIVVFLVTWAPFEVCAFVNPVCSFCIPQSAQEVVFWLLWLNSSINPILYPFLQQRFRIAFHRILCRPFSKSNARSAAGGGAAVTARTNCTEHRALTKMTMTTTMMTKT